MKSPNGRIVSERFVAACKNAQGDPDFAIVTVETNQHEMEEGMDYKRARQQLRNEGYGPPFILFEPDGVHGQRFPWLLRHVEEYLASKRKDQGPDHA